MDYIREEKFGHIVFNPEKRINGIYSLKDVENIDIHKINNIEQFKVRQFKIPSKYFHLKSPLIAFIELTRECNLSCKHCYIDAGVPRNNEMKTAEVKNLLTTLRKMDVFSVLLTGGELFLRSDAVDLINYAIELGFYTRVVTNGTLLNSTLLNKISNKTTFNISLDGVKTNDKLRPGVSFELIKEKIALLKSYNFPLGIICTIHKGNFEDLCLLLDWCMENDITFYKFDCQPVGRAYNNNEVIPSLEDIPRDIELSKRYLIHRQQNLKITEQDVFGCFIDFTIRLEQATQQCRGGRSSIYIAADGSVYPCSTCAAANRFLSGNILEKDFNDIWEKGLLDIRKIKWADFNECKTCLVPKDGFDCDFRCPALALKLGNNKYSCGATPFLRKAMYERRMLPK